MQVVDSEVSVVKSDDVISDELQAGLKLACESLMCAPIPGPDWHPGSDEKVLNLIHPSLYPLVYGKTRRLRQPIPNPKVALKVCCSGDIIPVTNEPDLGVEEIEREDKEYDLKIDHHNVDDYLAPGSIAEDKWRTLNYGDGWRDTEKEEKKELEKRYNVRQDYTIGKDGPSLMSDGGNLFSVRFQWLPSEVRFQAEGCVKITSYINNLHPVEHEDLYEVVESFITKAIPLWNKCLVSDDHMGRRHIECQLEKWDPPEPVATTANSSKEDDEDSSSDSSIYDQWSRRRIVVPEPRDFDGPTRKPWDRNYVNLERAFKTAGLQVIVKLTSIELTPEKPQYAGGSWHLEGVNHSNHVLIQYPYMMLTFN